MNRKPYVGQIEQPIERHFMQHAKADSPLGQGYCVLDNFTTEVVEECKTQEQANDRERFWIRVLKNKIPDGYDCSNGAEGREAKVMITVNNSSTNTVKLGEIIRECKLRNKMSMGYFARTYKRLLQKYFNEAERDRQNFRNKYGY